MCITDCVCSNFDVMDFTPHFDRDGWCRFQNFYLESEMHYHFAVKEVNS